MASYPLTRCPKCHKAFREEIRDASRCLSELMLVTCHYCGHSFPRFPSDPPADLPKAPRPQGR